MKKLTTVLAGVGIAVAAIGTLTLPANAADINTATANPNAAGDRVTGILDIAGPYAPNLVQSTAPVDLSANLLARTAVNAGAWELPAAGESGPITGVGALADLCLTIMNTGTHPLEGRTEWSTCVGTPQQQWTITPLTTGGYSINPEGAPLNRLAGSGGNGFYGFGDSVPATSPFPTFVIDNYSSLTPVVVAVEPVDITGPADGTVSPTRNPAFTGTGDDGAEVVLTDANGVELCRTTVANGVWDCTTTIDLPDGPLDVTATQTATDGSVTTDTVSIVIADPLNSPVIDPALAGGASIALLAAAGAVFAIRRKQTATA